LINPGSPAAAKENSAGKIIRVEGSVVIVREGKELRGRGNTKIFQSDEIKTGSDSLVELLLLDGSSLHLGPDSSLVLSQYKFSLKEDNPGFLCRMVKGIFIYISGAISKLHPEAVKFETPDGTVAIRGTKLVVRIFEKAAGPGASGKSIFILLKDPNGRVGKVIVFNKQGKSLLDKENHFIEAIVGKSPSDQAFMDRKTMETMIPVALYPIVFENYRPPLAYTEAFESLIDQKDIFVLPEVLQPVSISSP